MAGATRALVFDLGGVLIDIDFQRSIAAWSQASGRPAEVLGRQFQLDQAYRRHELGEIDFAHYARHLRQLLNIDLDDETLLQGWNALLGEALPGAAELLQRSARFYPCYVFSNTNAAHHRQWSQRQTDLLKPVKDLYLSYELGLRKPQARAFGEVARRIGCSPREILLFDDTRENILAAQRLGFQAEWVDGPAMITNILF